MPADILVAFARHQDERSTGSAAAWLEICTAALLELPGVSAARPFTVNVVLGERPPAFHPDLVMCQLDGWGNHTADANAALERASRSSGAAGATGVDVVAWQGTSVGVREDFDLSPHLYLQFSAHPPSMSFEEYSDWYQVHQDENIAQSPVLARGWRYRLEPLGGAERAGPTHLALYEIDGALETLTADLGRAMAAGVISLPDWFTRFASLEGTAVAGRLTP